MTPSSSRSDRPRPVERGSAALSAALAQRAGLVLAFELERGVLREALDRFRQRGNIGAPVAHGGPPAGASRRQPRQAQERLNISHMTAPQVSAWD